LSGSTEENRFILAFCWAHQRRDFLELAVRHPDLSAWAFVWVDKIGELYHLNNLRLAAPPDSVEFSECDQLLRQAVEQMADDRDAALKEPLLKEPAVKVLQSMENHWSGLTVFVDHHEVPMDNNTGERTLRTPVTGRKNYYGSGSRWSGEFTAMMFSLAVTVKLWGINPRTWLSAFLHACAANGNQAPGDLSAFLPWEMSEERLAMMKGVTVVPDHTGPKEIDTS
jgi:transposase